MKEEKRRKLGEYGFSLPELLVAIAITGVVMAGLYSVYYSQQRSYATQVQLVGMQQNLRVAMYHMETEIRMAGCDPTGTANAGIITANANFINFTEDIDGDGAIVGDEDITYSLTDNDGDGDNDLERNNNLIAENIDALNFVYLDENGTMLDDDGSGNVTTHIADIRCVQVTIVARTGRGDRGYINTTAYYNQQDLVNPILPAQNDNHRRRRLTCEVKCRNFGL